MNVITIVHRDRITIYRNIFILCYVLSIGFLLIFGCDSPTPHVSPDIVDLSELDVPAVRTRLFETALDESDLRAQLTSSGEKVYHEPKHDQPYTGWTKNIRKLQQFQNGKKHGIYISWYGNWERAEQGYYKNGFRDGVWIQWNPIGGKESEGTYKAGRRDGIWTLWDANGNKERELSYKDGRFLKSTSTPQTEGHTSFNDEQTDANFPHVYLLNNAEKGRVQQKSAEGIIRRFGKGEIKEIAYSPDGKLLAVATTIGIWLYDGKTGEEIGVPEHINSVRSIAFSPDGETLISGSSDTIIYIWEAATGRQIKEIKGAGASIHSVQYSPDGQMLLSVSVNPDIDLWDVFTGDRKSSVVGNIAKFSPDGGMFVAVNGSNLLIFDTLTGQSIQTIALNDGSVRSLHYSPAGSWIATRNRDNTVTLLNLFTKQEREIPAALDNNSNNVISFSPDGQILATASKGGTVSLWDVRTGGQKQLQTENNNGISSVKFSPDGSFLATGNKLGVIQLWDVQAGEIINTLISPTTETETSHGYQHNNTITEILINPDRNTLVSVFGEKSIQFWDLNAGKIKKEHIGYFSVRLQSLALSPNGKIVAGGGNDYVIRLWNTQTGELTHTLKENNLISSLVFSSDGTTLVSGIWGKTIRFWNPLTGQEKNQLRGQIEGFDGIDCISYSPDGTILASGNQNGDIHLWDVSKRELKSILKGHTSTVYSVAFSPDGKSLASGERNKSLLLWDVQSGALKKTLTGHTHYVSSVVFSSDGNTLISGSWDRTIRYWNVHTGAFLRNITWDCVGCLAISPDGKTLAGGGVFSRENKPVEIRLWDIETGQEKKTISAHTGWIFEIEFSADGNSLASVSSDGTVALWDVNSVTELSNGVE